MADAPASLPADLPPADGMAAQELADLIADLAKAQRHEDAGRYAVRLLELRPHNRRALRAVYRAPPPGFDVLSAWTRAMEAEPADDELTAKVARLRYLAGDADGAITAARAALARNAFSVDAHESLFRGLLRQEDFGTARDAWLAFHEGVPDRAVLLANRTLDRSTIPPGEKTLVLSLLARAGALGADHLDDYAHFETLALANAYAAEVSGDLVQAAAHLGEYGLLDGSREEFALGRERVAGKLAEKLQTRGAGEAQREAAARALVALRPDDLLAHEVLIEAATRSGDWPAAARWWQGFFAAGGERTLRRTRAFLGILSRTGDIEGAVAAWHALPQDTADGDEADAKAAHALVEALVASGVDDALDAGDWPRASAAIMMGAACDLDPVRLDRWRHQLRESLARALKQAPEDDLAVRLQVLRAQHGLDPDHSGIALKLGRALMRERLYQEARPVWETMVALVPDEVEPWLQLARSARKQGDRAGAAEAAARVLAIAPAHAEAAAIHEELAAP